jgi:adenylate cyclase
MPTSVFGGTFYNDSSDNLGQISPGFSPHNGMNFPNDGDDRRPSIASATTVSSTGSKSSVSGKFHKKLQGFFGDEYKGLEESSRQGSESSSMQGSRPGLTPVTSNQRFNDGVKGSSPPSPSSSRPRTPAQQGPSYDVTPWAFQDSQVSIHDDRGRHYQAEKLTRTLHQDNNDSSLPPDHSDGRNGSKSSSQSRLHLPGHRHNRSHEEKQSYRQGFAPRPSTSREQSYNMRQGTSMAQALKARDRSPTPSVQSQQSQQTTHSQRSPGANSGNHKRSLFDRVTGRHKHDDDKDKSDGGKKLHSPSVTSLPNPVAAIQAKTRDDKKSIVSKPTKKNTADATNGNVSSQKKEGSKLAPFRRKDTVADTSAKGAKDPNARDANGTALWHLDTDMSHMEGIVDHKQPPMTPPAGSGEIYWWTYSGTHERRTRRERCVGCARLMGCQESRRRKHWPSQRSRRRGQHRTR